MPKTACIIFGGDNVNPNVFRDRETPCSATSCALRSDCVEADESMKERTFALIFKFQFRVIFYSTIRKSCSLRTAGCTEISLLRLSVSTCVSKICKQNSFNFKLISAPRSTPVSQCYPSSPLSSSYSLPYPSPPVHPPPLRPTRSTLSQSLLK